MSSRSETSVIPISRSIAGRPVDSTSRLQPQGHQDAAAVLVVDDEPKMRELRRLLLETQGYVAIVAESGEKALEIMRARIVDAVILDYLMPGMDGEATARGIRALNLATPIILSTASLSVPERALQLMTAFVPKGLPPNRLMEVLQEELQRVQVRKKQHIVQQCAADRQSLRSNCPSAN